MKDFIKKSLFQLKDEAYRDFHSRLVPNLSKESIIGVRTPNLRKFTKEVSKIEGFETFLTLLPHEFYEENIIHGLYIASVKDFDKCIGLLSEFLPFIDNWASCDMLRPKCFKYNTDKLFPYVEKWICDSHAYTVRFAVGMLNSYYLDEYFEEKHLTMVSRINSQEYYVNMMRSWYFATALSKQYEITLPYLENKVLDKWTHNKAIQKSLESFRIPHEIKEYLKTLKV